MSKKNNLETVLMELRSLETLLNERIVENQTIAKDHKMMVEQFTHCFMYYREKVIKSIEIIKDILYKGN